MKKETRKRKKSTRVLNQLNGDAWLKDQVFRVAVGGKMAIDELMQEVGRTVIEGIIYMEREELSGPDYHPSNPDIKKWASQGGSVYVGDQKIRVERPRLRGPNGEMKLSSYEQLKEPGAFSEELLMKTLCGLSGRRYHETVLDAAGCFGVSPSSISRHIVEVTSRKLREFKERELSDFVPFSVFLDTVHRGGMAFVTALGIDFSGQKRVL
jgi:putative transposase